MDADRNDPDRVMVRSRIRGDIERALPRAEVTEDPAADYRFRAFVSREDLKLALAKAVDDVTYDRFKDVVEPDAERHEVYMNVWEVMAVAFGSYGVPGRFEAERAQKARKKE